MAAKATLKTVGSWRGLDPITVEVTYELREDGSQ